MPWYGAATTGAGGVPFRRVHDSYHSLPSREAQWEVTHIPYTNHDDAQFGGMSNEHWSVDVVLEDVAAYTNLKSMLGTPAAAVTPRSLSLFGPDGAETVYTGFILRQISNEKRPANAAQQLIFCTLQFEREAA